MPELALSRPYASRSGVPALAAVDPVIFTRRYFTHCMQCTFCHDACCQYGVDYDWHTRPALDARAADIEAFIGIPRERWFTPERTPDDNMPGGGSDRTAVVDGACVFRNRAGRGCLLHSYAQARGIDYHHVKPMVDCLFPLTWDGDLLCPAEEVDDGSLVCLDQGPTLYAGAREELRWYFGDALVAELDRMAERHAHR